MKAEFRPNSGQSIIEVLVALTVIVLSAASVAAVLFGGRSLLIDAQLEEEAIFRWN